MLAWRLPFDCETAAAAVHCIHVVASQKFPSPLCCTNVTFHMQTTKPAPAAGLPKLPARPSAATAAADAASRRAAQASAAASGSSTSADSAPSSGAVNNGPAIQEAAKEIAHEAGLVMADAGVPQSSASSGQGASEAGPQAVANGHASKAINAAPKKAAPAPSAKDVSCNLYHIPSKSQQRQCYAAREMQPLAALHSMAFALLHIVLILQQEDCWHGSHRHDACGAHAPAWDPVGAMLCDNRARIRRLHACVQAQHSCALRLCTAMIWPQQVRHNAALHDPR